MVAGHLQQKKGYWYIVLNLHDEKGKRKSKWISTHLPVEGNKRKAEKLLLEARQQHIDPYRSCPFRGLLFADYMLQWLAKMRGKVSPTTYRSYKYVIENSICPYFRERQILLVSLCPADLEEYYSYLQEQGASANTAIHHHANIHKALKDAVRLNLVARNVAAIVERPQKEKFLPDYYSIDEVNLLLDRLKGHWMYVPVLLSVFYGLRRSEVLGLRWGDVDFTINTITIRHTRVYGNVEGKGMALERDILKRKSSYRTLPMPEPVQTLLDTVRKKQYGEKEIPESGYVCLNKCRKPITPNYFTQCFKQFLQDNGLREVRLHALRHTCASLLIQNRTPLIEVQQWLGHSTLETAADLYAHLEYETKLRSADTMKKI